MKKVGICTINDDGNFGNRLQNYAVQEILKKKNINVKTIRKNSIIDRLKETIKLNIKRYLKKTKYQRQINFFKFNKNIKFENYNSEKKLNKIGKKYDIFITGSDQVWNPNFGRMTDVDFLTFANEEKRNSFSASFGVSRLPDNLKEFYTERLEKIKNISVREKEGKNIVEELTGRKDVEVLIDPTMMIKAEEWDKISKKPRKLGNDKYILNYFLGDISKDRKKIIEKVAIENNCKIINILDSQDIYYSCGPSEFLYLEKNAFLICTDSFHSSVFAILYNRPFLVFEREDTNENMNSRLENLLSKFELQDRKYRGGNIKEKDLKHDYSNSYKILDVERKKCDEFLMKILNNN